MPQNTSRHRSGDPRQRVYDSAAWARCRQVVLTRDGRVCQLCGNTGNVVDHSPPLAHQLAAGGTGTDPTLCRTLCNRCSGRVDGRRSGGGGRAPGGATAHPGGDGPRRPSKLANPFLRTLTVNSGSTSAVAR